MGNEDDEKLDDWTTGMELLGFESGHKAGLRDKSTAKFEARISQENRDFLTFYKTLICGVYANT